jgi:DNA (cytosine-5)-methyltransferase 1
MGTVGTVCTGIGGLDRGLHRAGWDLRWACERVAFRRDVLRRHWGPGLPVHEDVEALDPRDLEPVDLLAGGTPCPDFSHAKADRRGLDGDQSRLFWEFIRIRDHLEPDWTIWENVDGALSTHEGLDFALVLGAFVGAAVDVPRGGWPRAGVVAGPWGGAVWRVLDAQHFGTPQRRHRVFVVGRLGGPCPPEVLLEPARGGRDLAPSDAPAEDAARALGERVAGTLGAYSGRGGLTRSQVVDGHGAYVAAGEPVVIAPDVANTLVSSGAGRVDPLDGNLVFNVATSEGQSPTGAREADHASTLRAGGTSTADPGTVVVPFRKAQKALHDQDAERWEPADAAGTLAAGGGDANATICVPLALADVAHTVMPRARDGDRDETYVAYALRSNGSNARVAARETEIASALLAAGARAGAGTTEETVVLLIDGVRRLTPTECERIQGLPDNWTVPWGPSLLEARAWHELPADERRAAATPWDPPNRLDTPRRSACGDAVNAAVAEWIGRRLIGRIDRAMATDGGGA